MDANILALPPGWTRWAAACVAVLPAVITWRLYAPLLRRLDDPVLPERLASLRPQAVGILAAGIALVISLWPGEAIWAVPLALLARLRATYGIRRILLGENLTFAGYVIATVRFVAAFVGFWLLLAFTPTLILAAGNLGPLAAIVLGVTLVLSHWRYWDVVVGLWGARPLQREDLSARFAAVIDETRLAMPRIYQAGEAGAVFANAFALPSLRGASVVFTRTLLERLTADEIVAIFAHEVAHLESFTPARLNRLFVGTLLQIVIGVLLVPAVIAIDHRLVLIAIAIWWVAFIAVMIWRVSKVHANELASDRRAVELCDQPDALVSGLVHIHAIARYPTRWEARATTHPSLARRVRAIRASTRPSDPTDPPDLQEPLDPLNPQDPRDTQQNPDTRLLARPLADALAEPVLLEGASPGEIVLFDATTVRFLRGVAADVPRDATSVMAHAADAQRVAHADMRTCRLAARGSRAPELLVVDRAGRRYTAAIRDADVPRLECVLDAIEDRVPHEAMPQVVDQRIVALLALLLALIAGPSWVLLGMSAIVLWRPATDLLYALIAMIVGSGLLALIQPTIGETGMVTPGLLIAAGVLLFALLLLPRMRARIPPVRVPAWAAGAMAAVAGIVWLVILLIQWNGGLLRLVQTVRASSAVVLLPLGAAVLCARSRVRHRWVLAGALAAAALVPAAMMPSVFQQRVVRDPLLASMPELPRVPARMTLVARIDLESGAVMRLSPSARSVASGATEEDDHHDEVPTLFTVRTPDARVEQIAARDLQFLDDERVLVLVEESPGLMLRLHTLGQADVDASEDNVVDRAGAIHRDNAPDRDVDAPGDAAPIGGGRAGGPNDDAHAVRAVTRADSSSRKEKSAAVRSDATRAWTLRLPDFVSGRLSVDPRTGRWRVAGRDRRGHWLRVQGVLGNEIVDESRWTSRDGDRFQVLFDAGRALVSMRYAWPSSWLGRLSPRVASLLAPIPTAEHSLWRIGAGAGANARAAATPLVESAADLSCLEPEVNGGSTICFAYDDVDTRIWSIDAERGTLAPIGFLPGHAAAVSRGHDGSVLARWRGRPLIVHSRSPRAIELEAEPLRAARWYGGAYTAGHLALFQYETHQSSAVSTYQFAVDERRSAAAPAQAAADRGMLDGR